MRNVMLIGNPNCGKTTLFNTLTGENQRVGNWSGVTVDKHVGILNINNNKLKITDLPGLYSLTNNNNSGLDEKITINTILNEKPDVIVNVINACQLERGLYLTSQLLELNIPLIVVLNMTDLAIKKGIIINQKLLSELLKRPVVATNASLNNDFTELNRFIINPINSPVKSENITPEERYKKAQEITKKVITHNKDLDKSLTKKIDNIVLHRFFALPIFIGIMYLMFFFVINIGSVLQDFFYILSHDLFENGLIVFFNKINAPSWITAIFVSGIARGITITLTFVPIIWLMFFFLSLLEYSGYMARAAFVVDKIMYKLGLPGKAFIPMIIGFGCNVPAIMASRILELPRDRILTIIMSPFMSCSARFVIYVSFIAVFFHSGSHNIVFSLYLIGIIIAILTGLILQKIMPFGNVSPLLLELPNYHKISFKKICYEASCKINYFIRHAGLLIITVCMVFSLLQLISLDGKDSVLSIMGKWITPIFTPMGIDSNNWPAVMGLLTGILAKEVIIGTLQSLHTNLTSLANLDFNFWHTFKNAFVSIIHKSSSINADFLQQSFHSKASVYAYLLFILLYIPCASTMITIHKEAGKRILWFSVLWSFFIAYGVATSFYQIATINLHVISSLIWLSLILLFYIILVKLLSRFANVFFDNNSLNTKTCGECSGCSFSG